MWRQDCTVQDNYLTELCKTPFQRTKCTYSIPPILGKGTNAIQDWHPKFMDNVFCNYFNVKTSIIVVEPDKHKNYGDLINVIQ